MVGYVSYAEKLGCTIYGLTGRNDNQQAATIANLVEVGYDPKAFVADRFVTKWNSGATPPAWITGWPAVTTCTMIEYESKARAHIEDDLGATIVASYGDQYLDLLGGSAERTVKLPKPTYYLP